MQQEIQLSTTQQPSSALIKSCYAISKNLKDTNVDTTRHHHNIHARNFERMRKRELFMPRDRKLTQLC
jgi:hypothetical protein